MHKPHLFYQSYFSGFFMAAISGFSDVFGFIALDRLFTAHVTGNIVILIAIIINKTPGILSKALAVPLFIFFAMIISSLIETHGLSKKSLSFWLLMEILLFSLLLIFGVLIVPNLSVTSYKFILISMLPITAMAIHNTLVRTFMAGLPPVTVMTGNLTQFIVDFTAYIISPFKKTIKPRQKAFTNIKRFGNVLLGFLMGGLLSAFGYVWFGFWALLIIIALLLILTIAVTKHGDASEAPSSAHKY